MRPAVARTTKNGITCSVFCKPQRGKNVITWSEFLNRGLKPTVREARRKKALVHGRLRWIVTTTHNKETTQNNDKQTHEKVMAFHTNPYFSLRAYLK